MKIYYLFFDEEEFSDESRTTVIRSNAQLVETHRTFEGAVNAAKRHGFVMDGLVANDCGRGIISWPGMRMEKGLEDRWMEIVEDNLLD